MVGGNGVHGYIFPAIALAFALLMPATFSETTEDSTSTSTSQDTPAPTYHPECIFGISSETSATCVEVEGVHSACGALEDECFIGACYGAECVNGTLSSDCYESTILDGDCSSTEYTTLEDVTFPCEYSEELECAELTPAPAIALQLSGGCALNTCCECYMDIERDLGWAAINCEGHDQLMCGPVECTASSAFVYCEYPCTDGTEVTTGSEELDGWNSAEGRVDCTGGDCVAVLGDCPETADDSGTPSPEGDVSPVVEPSSSTSDDTPSGDASSPSTTLDQSAATKIGGVLTHALLAFGLPAILNLSGYI